MRKKIIFLVLVFIGFVSFAERIPLEFFKMREFPVTEEINSNLADTLSMEKYKPILFLYPEDVSKVFYDCKNNLTEYNSHSYTVCFYDEKNPLEVAGITLYKAIEFGYKKTYNNELMKYEEFLGCGICYYISLDPELQKIYTYYGNPKVEIIFGEKGIPALLSENFPISMDVAFFIGLDIKNGASSSTEKYNIFINYIDEVSKKVMCYEFSTGKTFEVANLPKMKNPKLYFGLPTYDAYNVYSLCLSEVKDEIYIEDNSIKRKNPGNAGYYLGVIPKRWDFVYVLDHTITGKQKSDVYLISGNEASKVEFRE